MSGLIGRKIGMTRVFDSRGRNVPVCVLEAGPCSVTQVKTIEKDGYAAIQLGFEGKNEKNMNKPELGHLKKANVGPTRFLREFPAGLESQELGDTVKVDIFEKGQIVKVTGWSKGKGFQGVVKRHGFRGGPKTHGQSDRLRAPGSIGQSAWPSRVWKGVKMGGRTGGRRVTMRTSEVVKVVAEKNIIMVKGSVPGPNGGLVLIRK